MPRILILHSSLGSGHISAAKALDKAFSHHPDVEVRIEDALALASPIMGKTLSQVYKQLSERAPQLYRMIYEGSDTEDLEETLDGNLLLAKIERPFYRKLLALVDEVNPDAIICVQQIPSRILQLLEQEGSLSQPQYVVITDVIAHSTWINYGVSGYFLPTDLTADILIQRGVDPALLHVTGIPINPEIAEEKSAADMRRKHDLPLDVPIVSLFGGGLHPKRVRQTVEKLIESSRIGMLVTVAGRNEQLTDAIADLQPGNEAKLRVLGLIDYVDDLVAASDLVITKSGGLIMSEVLGRGTPMIITDPFPGQEEWNADVVASSGAGIQLRLPEMIPLTVDHLLSQPEQLAFMRRQAHKVGQPRAAFHIAERVLADLEAREQTPVSPLVEQP